MTEKKDMEQLLDQENSLLDTILGKQAALRKTINNRNWNDLIDIISEINLLADCFKKVEFERETLSAAFRFNDFVVFSKLSEVRGKLVRSRSENKALCDYISITQGFVQGIIEDAVPQSRNKLYSRTGKIVHPQPSSVVVNTLY
jgi:hypothetical protein